MRKQIFDMLFSSLLKVRLIYAAVFFALCSMLLARCSSAEAQQAEKVPRIGYLSGSSLSVLAAHIEAFREGLRDLGYVEGKNMNIEYRFAEGKFERLPELES